MFELIPHLNQRDNSVIVIRFTPAIAFFQYTDVNKTSIYTNVPYKLTNKD